MPTIAIKYESEGELCELLRTISAKLQCSESKPSDQDSVLRLRRSLSGLPIALTPLPDAKLTASGGLLSLETGRHGTFGSSVTIEDPDNPGTLIEVGPESGLAFQPSRFTTAAVGPFATFGRPEDAVIVQDAKGKYTRQRKVPVDLFLLEALQKGGSFGDVVAGLSRGVASIIGLGPNTSISEQLANLGGSTIPAVHLRLALPLIDVPGVGKPLFGALIQEADTLLLTRDRAGLEESVNVFEGGAALPSNFPSLFSSKRAQEVEARNRGNLLILQQEEDLEIFDA